MKQTADFYFAHLHFVVVVDCCDTKTRIAKTSF